MGHKIEYAVSDSTSKELGEATDEIICYIIQLPLG